MARKPTDHEEEEDAAPRRKPGKKQRESGGSYIESNLMRGETLIRTARMHPLVVAPPAVFAAFCSVIAIIGFVAHIPAVGILALIAFLFAWPVILARLVDQQTTEYGCTNRRIVIKSGLLTTRVREMPLAKVEALFVSQPLFGKILGYGTLVFKGSGGTRRTCSRIAEPFEFYETVQEQVAIAHGHD